MTSNDWSRQLERGKTLFDRLFRVEDDLAGVVEGYQEHGGYVFYHLPKNGGSSVNSLVQRGKVPVRYSGHENAVKSHPGSICIVRCPYDRFVSAYAHSQKKFSHVPEIAEALGHGIKTADPLAPVLGNPSDPRHTAATNVVRNRDGHKVDGKLTSKIWTYEPQATWRPERADIVLDLSSIAEQWKDLSSSLGWGTHELPHSNVTHAREKLTRPAAEYIRKTYTKDFPIHRQAAPACTTCSEIARRLGHSFV